MGIFGNAFSGWHVLIILVVVLLLFGATRLPALAKSVGQSVKILRKESGRGDGAASATGAPATDAAGSVAEPDPAPTRTDATT